MASGKPVRPSQQTMRTVHDAAVGEFGADAGPEFRSFGGLDPDPQQVFDAVQFQVQVHGDVGGPVLDLMSAADFDNEGVQADDRVDLLQRSGLPFLDLFEDRVGDSWRAISHGWSRAPRAPPHYTED